MRVLFILGMKFDPEAGGVQKTTYKLASRFAKDGVQNAILAPSCIGIQQVSNTVFYKLTDSSKAYCLQSIKNAIDHFNPNVIINQMPHDLTITGALKKLNLENNRSLLIGCLRNSLFSVKNDPKTYVEKVFNLPSLLANISIIKQFGLFIHFVRHRSALKKILDTHDRFVLLTEANRRELNFFVKDYKSEKVSVIPNSIPSVHRKTKKSNIILYVGRLAKEQKRAELLVPLWQRLFERMQDWKFVIVGDGPLFDEIQNGIHEKKLERIYLTGKQNPSQYYEQAKICVMTSAFEGFPNVLIEAMSYGVVPVCFRSYGAVSEVMESGKDGILVDDMDLEVMSNEIIQLIAHAQTLEKLSKSSLETAARYQIDKVIKKWYAEFENHGITTPLDKH